MCRDDPLVADHGADGEAEGTNKAHPPWCVFHRLPKLFRKRLDLLLLVRRDSLCFLGVFELRNHLVHIVAHNRALFGGFGANAELAILSAAKPKNSVSDGFEVGAGAR